MKCPKCGSTKIKLSHSRGFQERLKKLFHQRIYRCIKCNWRGILKAKSSHISTRKKKKILVLIIFVIIAVVISSIVYSCVEKRYYIGVKEDDSNLF